MPNVTGTGTVQNLPNFAGALYTPSSVATPFLSMIGGRAVKTTNSEFPTSSEYSHETPAQPTISETASLTAPKPVTYVRDQKKNVVQIFHEKVSVSYERLGNSGRLSGINTAGTQPAVTDELDFQTARALEKISRDIEYTFINGVYQLSTGSSEANKTRGIVEACGTVADAEGAVLSKAKLNELFRLAYAAGVDLAGGNIVLMCNTEVKQMLSDVYGSQWGANLPTTRNVGGFNLRQIETDFGMLSIMLHPFVAQGQLLGVDVGKCRPVEQDTPGKGNFFREALSKTGAAEEYQIFGHIGLDHGPSFAHFRLDNIAFGDATTPIPTYTVSATATTNSGDDETEE